MKTIALTTAFVALAAFANAQTYTQVGSQATPNNRQTVSVGTLNSATTPTPVSVGAYESVFISCVGSAASTSQTVRFETNAGRVLETTSVNCTTSPAVVVSRTAGNVGFQQVVISPTAGLTAANVVTNTVLRTPAVSVK